MDLFSRICTLGNLRNAWIKAQFHATTQEVYHDALSYELYGSFLDENLVILRQELISLEYRPKPYRQLLIPKSNGEKRKIYFPSPKDNIVIHAILNVLGNVFEPRFVDGNLGYRLALGEKENKSIYLRWQDSYPEYISRARSFIANRVESFYHITDIRRFYPSVNISLLLKDKIAPLVDDRRIVDLLNFLLDTVSLDNAENADPMEGLPTGTALAPFLANVYLHDLDRKMVSITTDYIRYVDDICFVCKNESTFELAVSELHRGLEALGLEANALKTKSEPITNPEFLMEHTRKMHYDQRFGFISESKIDKSEQKQAVRTFSDMFLSASSEEDIQSIAHKSATFVVRFLEAQESELLQNLTLNLLEAGIERFASLKIVLATQMKIALETGINLRFQIFLKNAQDYEKVIFLQLLPQFAQLDNAFTRDLLNEWTASENSLIRAISIVTLHRVNMIPSETWLEEKILRDESEFVKACMIICLSQLAINDRQFLHLYSKAYTSTLQFAFNFLIERILEDFSALSGEIIEVMDKHLSEISSEEQVKLLYILLRYNSAAWVNVYSVLKTTLRRPVSLITFSKLASLSLLQESQLIANLNDSPYRDEIQQILADLGILSDSNFEDTDATKQGEGLDFRLPWLECDRISYQHLSDHAGYESKIITCPDGTRASIEYITVNRIKEAGWFASVEQWWEYLAKLEEKNLIHILEKGLLRGDRTYCIYRIPDGLETLYEAIQNRRPLDVLQIMSSIITAMDITQSEGFLFHGIVPQNIILTANDPCKLINIGFGLRSPNHNCAQPDCRHYQQRPEVGPTTGYYFLGLTTLEILAQQCPMELLHRVSDANRDDSMPDILARYDLEPHLRSILARLLQANAEYRYGTISPLFNWT
jgi:retron-type reverse transcriptase